MQGQKTPFKSESWSSSRCSAAFGVSERGNASATIGAQLFGCVQRFVRKKDRQVENPHITVTLLGRCESKKGEKTEFCEFLVGWKGPLPSLPARNLEARILLPKSATSPCPCLLLTKNLLRRVCECIQPLFAYHPSRHLPLLMPKRYPHDSKKVLITKPDFPLSPEMLCMTLPPPIARLLCCCVLVRKEVIGYSA